MRTLVRAAVGRDGVNYLVTNHIPRRLATRAMGWFSRIEQPLVARLSLAIWRAAAGDALRLAKPTAPISAASTTASPAP